MGVIFLTLVLLLASSSYCRHLTQSTGLKTLMLWDENMYYVSQAPATYSNAEQQCQSIGAELLAIQSPYESFTVSRRFAGSDYGDHSLHAYTELKWGKNEYGEDDMGVWISNKKDDLVGDEVNEFGTPYSLAGLVSQLNGDNSCVYLEPRVKYNPNGVWRNDAPCSSKLHFVCKKPAPAVTPQFQSIPLFLSLTLDCIVSPKQLNIDHVFKHQDQLLATVAYPSGCSMKGYGSSTGVTSINIDAQVPKSVLYFIIDPTRMPGMPVSFQGGLVSYVNSVDEVLDMYSGAQEIYPNTF